MNEIRILDDQTINKIAAGEVVERPVSVVKELVENAIDAGAKNITVEIKGGGIDHIRVTDNGHGIEYNSIQAAFMRHATSKIRTAEDLLGVTSLGFRGEALSSIAAVAQVELMTKTKSSILGYRYCMNGGREMSFDEAGVPDGTTMIVRNLFYNTPARRKFLKSALTEGGYVTQLMEKLILSHPDISFKYITNSVVKLSSNGGNDILSNAYTVFGRDIQKSLVEVSFDSETCTVSGYIGKPESSRGNRNYELFFVNGRCIKSKVLSAATEEAYSAFLMQHRYPFVILYLDIPSELIDVNVHPAKTEIRFVEEKLIYSIITSTVTEGLTRHELIPDAAKEEPRAVQTVKASESLQPEPFEASVIGKMKAAASDPEPLYRESSYSRPSDREPVYDRITEHDSSLNSNFVDTDKKENIVQPTLFSEGFFAEGSREKHRIVGQVFGTYWIIEYEGKMYMIDQHAAHEKILYERFTAQIKAGGVVKQLISPPFVVSLSAAQEDAVKSNLGAFSELGFTIEHFGGREYALSSVPSELFRMTPQDYFLSVVDDLAENPKVKEPMQVKDRIATMSCKAAVKGNMHLSFAEADELIEELFSLENPYNCPHGRPTIVSFSKQDIEKMFKRIV